MSAPSRSLVVSCAAIVLAVSGARSAHARRPGRPYHPAPRIVVDVVDAQGDLLVSDLQRIARNTGYWPFRRCYEDGLRRDQRLKGKVTVEILVTPDGSVESSTMTAATLADDDVATCVAQEAQRFSFSEGESPTTATLSVSLSPGDEPVPPMNRR